MQSSRFEPHNGLFIIGEERLAGNSIRRDDSASPNPIPDRYFPTPMEIIFALFPSATTSGVVLHRELLPFIVESDRLGEDVSNPFPPHVGMW